MHWTSYPDLLRPTSYERHSGTFGDLEAFLRGFALRTTKGGTLIGPYALKEQPNASRHNDYVRWVTAAVFDVDHDATPARLTECHARLADTSCIWYPSFSHSPTHPAYRLILELANPIHPKEWRSTRAALLECYAIPADPATSCSVSHAYYVPSHGPDSVVRTGSVPVAIEPSLLPEDAPTPELPDGWAPPVDDAPVDLTAVLVGVRSRAAALKRSARPERGEWLARLADGRPLTDDGHWHAAVTSTAMTLTLLFPELGINTLTHLFASSIRGMRADCTLREVHRRLASAMQKRARDAAKLAAAIRHFSGF